MRPLPVIASALLILAMPGIGRAQETLPDERKNQVIREILQLTGAAALSRQVMEQMLPPLKQAVPNVPESFWDEFMAEVDVNELADLVVPVYARHFTLEELEQLVAFYKTPLGKKMINEMPMVMQESMAVGQEWGADIARRAQRKARARQSATPS